MAELKASCPGILVCKAAQILEKQYARAKRVLEERRGALEAIARRLLELETLDRLRLQALVGPPAAADSPAEAAVTAGSH